MIIMATGSAAELHNLLRHKPQRKPRQTPTQKRREIAEAQISALRKVIFSIRRRIREMPAWATAYNSAITAIEMEIADIESAKS